MLSPTRVGSIGVESQADSSPILRVRWTTTTRPSAPRRAGVTIFLQAIAVLLLVLGNAFFVAAEYALVTASAPT